MAAFDVWLPLQSRRCAPEPLTSAVDPKRTFGLCFKTLLMADSRLMLRGAIPVSLSIILLCQGSRGNTNTPLFGECCALKHVRVGHTQANFVRRENTQFFTQGKRGRIASYDTCTKPAHLHIFP